MLAGFPLAGEVLLFWQTGDRFTMRPYETSSHIPLTGMLLLVFLCFLWGTNIVSIKVSNVSIPPLIAATTRSVVASFLLWLYGRLVDQPVALPRGYGRHGLWLGLLFGGQFLFLYWGLSFTDASRAIIFLYVQPLVTVLMAHFVLPDDRLGPAKAVGICLAFVGLILVFGSGSRTLGEWYWVGDLMALGTGLLWAATNIYVKRFINTAPITHFQTLFAQLFFSIPVLAVGALVLEWGRQISPEPIAVAALAYQSIIVAFITYLAWFRMMHQYPVSRLTSFTFLTPLFGVILGGVLLGEALTLFLWIGLGLVAAGIYLVNRPADLGSRVAS